MTDFAKTLRGKLSNRAVNALINLGVVSVDDINSRSDESFLRHSNIGRKTLREIRYFAEEAPPYVEENCHACKFYDPFINSDDGDAVCRRYPPTPFLIGDEADIVWPTVDASDWCGEFKRNN